jgi:tRNA-specific 2-thiouridylase
VEALRFPSGRPGKAFRAAARVRHRAPEVPAQVIPEQEGARVLFDRPVRAVAPGQSCVFYDGDVVIGGGVLKKKKQGAGSEEQEVGTSQKTCS